MSCLWMSRLLPSTLRPATCCMTNWSVYGPRRAGPSSSSRITCAKPQDWEIGWRSLPSGRAASSGSLRWNNLAHVRSKIRRSPGVRKKSSAICEKRSTRAWSRSTGFRHENSRQTSHLLRDRDWSMARGSAATPLAAVSISASPGSAGISLGGICRPQFLDCDSRQHETHSDRICTFGGNRRSAGRRNGQQQIFGADLGWSSGQPAESAQYLLASDGGAVVRAVRESDPFRGGDGLGALGHHCDGIRPQTAAKDLRHGRTKSGCTRLQTLSVCTFSCEPSLSAYRPQAGLGLRMALVDCGRNDFRQPRIGSTADDGPRPERHEPGYRGDDSDRHNRVHRGWLDLQDLRAATAIQVGLDLSDVGPNP